MSRVAALVRMRVRAYLRSGRVLGPSLAAVALLGLGYAGGASEPGQAYGFAAALLLGVYAWQARTVLDTEPDEQRMLARAAVGSPGREVTAGLLAAGAAAVPMVLLAVLAPAGLGAISWSGADGLGRTLVFGLWVHSVTALCGTGLGVLVSRAVLASAGWSAVLLVGVPVLVLVLGSRTDSPVRWLVPPVLEFARADAPTAITLVGLLAVGWSLASLGGYATLRRTRP